MILLEILNATHPHLIPISDLKLADPLPTSTAISHGGRPTSSSNTGEQSLVYTSQTTDASHLALPVQRGNSPRAAVTQTRGTFLNAGLSTDSSDTESFHSAMGDLSNQDHILDHESHVAMEYDHLHDVSMDRLPAVYVDDVDTPVPRRRRQSLFRKGINFLQSWRQQANGSPGRPIKIFTSDASGMGLSVLEQAFSKSGGLDISHSTKSLTSSYATCIDTDEWFTQPPHPAVVVDQAGDRSRDTHLGLEPGSIINQPNPRVVNSSAIPDFQFGAPEISQLIPSSCTPRHGSAIANGRNGTVGRMCPLESTPEWREDLTKSSRI